MLEPLPYEPVVPVEPLPVVPAPLPIVPVVPAVSLVLPGAGVEALSVVLGAPAPSCPTDPVLGAPAGVVPPDVPAAVPERDPLSEAQAPSSSPPAPTAAQSQSLFIVMRVFLT